MNRKGQFLLLLCSITWLVKLKAQEKQPIHFGNVLPADFKISAPAFDSNASAVVIADIGNSAIEGSKHGLGIVFTRFVRVKIINKNGYPSADFRIDIYDDNKGTQEYIEVLKGTTYNLENGKVQETPLDAQSVFTERINKYRVAKKFSMPALKEGSIFEMTYTVRSNLFNDPPTWVFQDKYPVLWSEYQTTFPSNFHYLLKTRGDTHFDVKTNRSFPQTLVDGSLVINCTSYEFRWVKKNVPVIRNIDYLSSPSNYNSSIYFELEYFLSNDGRKYYEKTTWEAESHALLIDDQFGEELGFDNKWMDEILKPVVKDCNSPEEEIHRIFNFVRDNFHCTHNRGIYKQAGLKEICNKRAGTEADLNLLLTALLKHRSMRADAAILSTRENGFATPSIPLLYEYNYVICAVNAVNKTYLLDASQPFNAFNRLPYYCYNGPARLINDKNSYTLSLSPDSLWENKTTNIMMINDEKGLFTGSITRTFGDIGSFSVREKAKEKSVAEYFKGIRLTGSDIEISDGHFDSLSRPDFPLTEHLDFDFRDLRSHDIVYYKPLLGFEFETNPFPEDAREYPVEFSSMINYLYVVTMEVPEGFQVDELPKSARIRLNENDGFFEYLIQQTPQNIQMRVKLKLNKAEFSPDDYSNLRDFFAFVVNKANEQIVFRKVK